MDAIAAQLCCITLHPNRYSTLSVLHCTACSFFMTIELHRRNFLQEFATTVKRERESEEEQAERDRGKKIGRYVDIERQHDINIYAKEEDSRIDAHLVSAV